jgi:GPH family glycoside/pentoside/hexuronide:cation symporter
MGGVAVWALLVKKHTLMPSLRAALIVLAAAFIPLYFMTGLIGAVIASCAVGFGFAGVITTMDIVGARIMDEDTKKHNLRREGTYASAMGFMNRLSGLFTSLAFLMTTRIYGFVNGDNPGAHPDSASRFLLTVFPFGVMVISVVISRFLKFPELDAPVSGGKTQTEPEARVLTEETHNTGL